MNDGSFAQDEFLRIMKARPNTHLWRLRDKKDLMGINRGRKVAAFALPSDFLVGEPGRVFFAEVKSFSSERFDYSNIEAGQRSAASIAAAIGAPYYFFIYSMKHNKWFELTAEQFSLDIKAGKKSRRIEELSSCSTLS